METPELRHRRAPKPREAPLSHPAARRSGPAQARRGAGGADPECASCFFACALKPEARRLIAGRRVFRTREKGEFLFRAGDSPKGVWCVCRGRLKVYQDTPEGKQLITRIALPGDVVGHRSLLAGTPLRANGVALETTTVFLPAAVLHRLIEIEPIVGSRLMQRLAAELGHAESLATNMAYSRAEERVLAALAGLRRGCRGAEGSTPIELSVPRQELAELSGLTVEAAVRTLRRLEEAGLIETQGRRIRVIGCLDPGAG